MCFFFKNSGIALPLEVDPLENLAGMGYELAGQVDAYLLQPYSVGGSLNSWDGLVVGVVGKECRPMVVYWLVAVKRILEVGSDFGSKGNC